MEILKRTLSALLALILVAGMVPVPASASEIAIEPAAVETVAAEAPAVLSAETTAPAETVPVTTAPAETVPETTAAAETVPETTAAAETVPETTAPVETVPETTAPAETVPETTAPAETVPETTAATEPEETLAEETASEPAMGTVTASGICGDDLSWVYDEVTRTLTVSGTGDMYDYEWYEAESRTTANWSAFASQIRSVILGEGVSSVGSYAFAGCSALTTVVLNEEVSVLGAGAFAYCPNISYLRIPASVSDIGSEAFRGSFTSAQEQLRFEGDVPVLAEDAFAGITVTVRYPYSYNDAWVTASEESYGGTITWKPYNDSEFITEATLQQWIEEGETELFIDSDAFLEGSFTLPGDVTLTIQGGSLTVYPGAALTIQGRLVVDGGSLTVQEGGSMAVNGTLVNQNSGVVTVSENYTVGANGQICNVYEGGSYGEFVGMAASELKLIVNAYSDSDFTGGLAFLEEQGFGSCEVYVLDAVTVSDDLTIPENCTVFITLGSLSLEGSVIQDGNIRIEDGEDTALTVSGSLDVYGTIESDARVYNYGSIEVKSGGRVHSDYLGVMNNQGQITVNPNGTFEVEYNWYGTDPVDNGGTIGGDVFEMNAALLERRTREFFAEGEVYVLWRPFTADEDLTIPEGGTLVAYHEITVPEGVTMTVNCELLSSCTEDDATEAEEVFLTVEEGGHLILGEDARMFISGCNAEVYGTLTNNGTVDDDADEKMLVVYGTVNNNGTLSGNMAIYGQVRSSGILYNMCPDTECYVTLYQGGSLVNDGMIVTKNMILTVETGATLTNNYVIANDMGTILIDGRYVHAEDALLYQMVTGDGIGTITGIPMDHQLLYAEIFDDTDFGTVAGNLASEMENGYPSGEIQVLGEEMTLSDSITIPANVALIFESGTTVIDGGISLEGGDVYVSEDAALENNGSIDINEGSTWYHGGQLTGTGSITVNENGVLRIDEFAYLANGSTLDINEGGVVINDGTLENGPEGILTVNEGGTLRNNGSLINAQFVDEEDPENVLNGTIDISGLVITYGYVQNSGVVTVYEPGQLLIYGEWEGNGPVNEGGTIVGDTENAPIDQDTLEALLAESTDMEEPFLLNGPAILDRNFVIPEGAVLEMGNGGSFVIPKNVTFTVNGTLVLYPGAQLDIPEGSRLVNAGYIAVYTNHESDGHLYVEGSYTQRINAVTMADYTHDSVDTITGIARKNITLLCETADESALTRCIDLTKRDGFAGAEIYYSGSAFWSKVSVPKNVMITLVYPYYGDDQEMDYEYTHTVTVSDSASVSISGTFVVPEGIAMTLEGSMNVASGGKLYFYGDLAAPNEEDPTNIPTNNGGRIYAGVSGISIDSISAGEIIGTTAYVDKQTLEEGYVELTVSAETNDDYYSALPLVKWTSDKGSIVDANKITYHGGGVYRVPVKEGGFGPVKLTATSIDGNKKTAVITLNAYYVDPAKKLTMESTVPEIGLQQGDEAQVSVFGDNEISPEYLEFTSSNEDILTVDEEGVIIGGEKTGTATVTATLVDDPMNRKVSLKVKVIVPQTRSLTLAHDEPNQESETALALDLADLDGESYTFFIYPEAHDKDGIMELTGRSLKWTSSNTKLATVKGLSDGTAEVTIKAKQDGMAAITAETTDLAKLKASLSLTVMDYSPRLASTSLTLNPNKEDSCQVALIPSYGNEILDVYFEDEDRLYASYDEGVLTIVPSDELKNGTINAKLTVLCERETDDGDWKETEYTFNLKISVRKSMPSVTLKQVGRFELFYTDSTVQLQATAKDARISDIYMESEFFDLDYDEETGVATVYQTGYADTLNDISTRVKVYIGFEGYYEYVEKSINLNASKAKPSLTADPSSSVINTRLSGDYKTYFKIYNKTTKSFMALTNSDINGEYVDSVSSNGLVCLDFGGDFRGSASVDVQLDNWLEPITVKHSVKVSDSLPKAKLGSSNVKLNTSLAAGEVAEIPVTLAANVRITRFLGLNQNSTFVTLTYDADRGVLLAKLNRGYTGSYKYELTPVVQNSAGQEVRLDPVKLTVQAKDANVTVSHRTSGKLDVLDPNSAITYTITKINNAAGRVTNVALSGADRDMFQLTELSTDASGNQTFQLKLVEQKREAGEYSTKETYQVSFVYTICGKTIPASALRIKVTQSKLTLAAPAVTFYQSQSTPMSAKLTSDVPIARIGINGSKTSPEIVAALGSSPRATMTISEDRKEAQINLVIAVPGHLVAGKTYKLVLNVYPEGNCADTAATQITVNVKVNK